MRRIESTLATLAIAALVVALSAAPVRAGDDGYSYARIVRLSLVTGDVQVNRPADGRSDKAKWEPALLNMPLQQGFSLGTNDGRAEIELESGAAIWLGENSVLQFSELALSNGGRITKLYLSQGKATFFANLSASDSFSLSTPDFQVTPPAKSEFRVNVSKAGGTVAVLNGRVSVSSPAGEKNLEKGEIFSLDANAPAQASITQSSPRDDWDKWVSSRENLLVSGQSQSLQYTNAPIGYGMADLSSYGTWNTFPGLGFGWQPYGVLNGWAPFSAGQWSYYPGLGWTWLSAEPWGWVPYHFGSWAYSPVFGWLWLPGGYGFWSPAPVQWVTLGNRYGWSPVNPVQRGTALPGTKPAPIVVATRELGKGGMNRVLTNEQVNGKLEVLSAQPAFNGKGAGASRPLLAVPTASSLESLRAGVAFDPALHRFVNAAPTPETAPRPIALNGAPPGAKLPPSPPPVHAPALGAANQPGVHGAGGVSSGAAQHGGAASAPVHSMGPPAVSHPR